MLIGYAHQVHIINWLLGGSMGVLGFGAGFRDVREWHTRVAVLERQICWLERADGGPVGTAFLVGPDLILTANHVLRGIMSGDGSLSEADPHIVARFDYYVSPESGQINEGVRYSLASPGWLIGASPVENADVALIRLGTSAGREPSSGSSQPRGWLDLSRAVDEPKPGSALAILQHAQGEPLKVAMNTDSVVGTDLRTGRLLHRTDTAPGSSGAPCFDIDWQFLAMHQGRTFETGNLNYGIACGQITNWLDEANLRSLVTETPPLLVKAAIASLQPAHSSFPLDPKLKQLLYQHGESQWLELKECATEASEIGKRVKPSRRLLISVAAFMNSREGGTILIGVSDDNKFVGIEQDYARVDPQRKNWDGYQSWLIQTLRNNLEVPSSFQYFSIVRFCEAGKDICAIHVQAAESPVFMEDLLYVRTGNRNEAQRGHHLLAYVANRWSWMWESKPVANEMR